MKKNITLKFRHRQFHEYFEAWALREHWDLDKSQLRKRGALMNEEFMNNFFIPLLRKEALDESNIPALCELGVFRLYFKQDPEYIYSSTSSEEIAHTLSRVSESLLEYLLEDLKLDRRLAYTGRNAQFFWRNGKIELGNRIYKHWIESLDQRLKSKEGQTSNNAAREQEENFESIMFYRLNIKKSDVIDDFQKIVRGNTDRLSGRSYSFEESGIEKLRKCFFRIVIDFHRTQLAGLIKLLEGDEMLDFLEVLSEPQRLLAYKDPAFKKSITVLKKKIAQLDSKLPIVLLFRLVFKMKIDITKDEIYAMMRDFNAEDSYTRFKRYGRKLAWLDIVLSHIEKDEIHTSLDYFDQAEAYAVLYKEFIASLKDANLVPKAVNKYIHYIQEQYRSDRWPHFMQHETTILMACVISISENKHQSQLIQKILAEDYKISRMRLLDKLLELDETLFRHSINFDDINNAVTEVQESEKDFQVQAEMHYIAARLLLSLGKEEDALLYLNEGLKNTTVRYGWHKDVSIFNLVDVFEETAKKHFLSKSELNKYANNILALCMRVMDISDGDEVRWAPLHVFDAVLNYDIEEAKKMRKRIVDWKRWYENSLISKLAMAKIKLGDDLKDEEEGVYKLIEEFDNDWDHAEHMQSKEKTERQFLVYLAIANSNLYSQEERKEAFNKAYDLVNSIHEKQKDAFLHYPNEYAKEAALYASLCKKYKKQVNLSFKEREQHSYWSEEKNDETDFVNSLLSRRTAKAFEKQLLSLEKMEPRVVITKQESWQKIHDKCLSLCGNINPIVLMISKFFYFGYSDYHYQSRYLYIPLVIGFSDISTRKEIVALFDNHFGVGSLWRAHKIFAEMDMREECIEILKRNYELIRFLLY